MILKCILYANRLHAVLLYVWDPQASLAYQALHKACHTHWFHNINLG